MTPSYLAHRHHRPPPPPQAQPPPPLPRPLGGAVDREPTGARPTATPASPGPGRVHCFCSRPIKALLLAGCRPARYYPSCSDYAVEAFSVHRFWRAFGLTARRLLRCRPFGPHGIDLVPLPEGADPAIAHQCEAETHKRPGRERCTSRADPRLPCRVEPDPAGLERLSPAAETVRLGPGRPLRRVAELRVRHRRSDRDHHAGAHADHGEEHPLHDRHAATTAGAQEAAGQVQGPGKPGAAESGNDEAVQGERDKPVRRLSAAASPNAVPDCPLFIDPGPLEDDCNKC